MQTHEYVLTTSLLLDEKPTLLRPGQGSDLNSRLLSLISSVATAFIYWATALSYLDFDFMKGKE